MSVDQSGGLSMEIGVLYLSHAMLVLAELIVCSKRGFAGKHGLKMLSRDQI